jgi:predicted RNA binding protein YcfA (HicA-like mRNA interferase family)
MPRKVRQLITDLLRAGFAEVKGAGNGSHRKFFHSRFPGAVTISGKDGQDVKHY